ncbi:winged helix-turn-helix domain-containing protein [Nonomuraea sp. NPDC050790]|uniref:winged helix-turn-helix domain-containing protein n=1 Tax=Nonomuraea sp. NPDC050790 TaxID=3364371 RepID=UPI0037905FAE
MSSPSGLDVLVLGPVMIRAGEALVRVERPLERALLARLALAGGRPVPDGRLAADLWGEAELTRPTERLRVLASRLRTALSAAPEPDAPGARLVRVAGG